MTMVPQENKSMSKVYQSVEANCRK
uniref:Uncharacterized protein n=1 Tax=Rhizophora mucronata TaxID=61149 RepID=A0A2P2MGP6_RHIMU